MPVEVDCDCVSDWDWRVSVSLMLACLIGCVGKQVGLQINEKVQPARK